MTPPTGDRDYILGTHDDEISRLGLQHRVWRPRVLDAWQRAGFGVGQTLLDVGSGPGYASVDLAEIVGGSGHVLAIDRSRRFLDALDATRRERRLDQLTTHELDLDEGDLPVTAADGAWGRWVLAFVKRPRDVLSRISAALKPGARVVLHEYLDYGAWRLLPRSPEFEEFVEIVIASWRAAGGEPNVGMDLPSWLVDLGFETAVRPIVDVVPPSHAVWQWPRAFVNVGLQRLVDLGHLGSDRADTIWRSFLVREAVPTTLMVTPVVLEIIATKRRD